VPDEPVHASVIEFQGFDITQGRYDQPAHIVPPKLTSSLLGDSRLQAFQDKHTREVIIPSVVWNHHPSHLMSLDCPFAQGSTVPLARHSTSSARYPFGFLFFFFPFWYQRNRLVLAGDLTDRCPNRPLETTGGRVVVDLHL
jgi:hypothetical protein